MGDHDWHDNDRDAHLAVFHVDHFHFGPQHVGRHNRQQRYYDEHAGDGSPSIPRATRGDECHAGTDPCEARPMVAVEAGVEYVPATHCWSGADATLAVRTRLPTLAECSG